jgi:lipopolysaccharide transport system ATP-binding protein
MSFNEFAIRVTSLSKKYDIYDSPGGRLKEFIFNRFARLLGLSEKHFFREFWALRNISFEVEKGETVGILGMNGAGKSTLLQVLSGVVTPSSGHVEINGRIVALLELGAGFNFEFTGRENIYIYGAILGLSTQEMIDRLDAIVDFAEIGQFIDLPVKTYSSGMYARLAFSIAIHVDPEILIVDETLSVGDSRFQQKCIRKIDELKSSGCTILVVSHDVLTIKNICKKGILIHEGALLGYGEVQEVANKYFELINFKDEAERILQIRKEALNSNLEGLADISALPKMGNGNLSVVGAGFFNLKNKRVDQLRQGDSISLKVLFDCHETQSNVFIGFLFKDERGIDIFGCNSLANDNSYSMLSGNSYLYEIVFKVPYITNKKYLIDLALSRGTWNDHKHLCWIHDALIVEVFMDDQRFFSQTFVSLPREHINNEKVCLVE